MRILELFSGTGSIAKVARARGHEVVTLDICPRHRPTICRNILEWDYTQCNHTLDQLHSIPPGLCADVIETVEKMIGVSVKEDDSN